MIRRVGMAFVVLAGALAMPAGVGAQIDGKAVQVTRPEDIKWVRNAAGTQEQAILFGDPNKEGPYVVRLRWLPGNMSRPHMHPNDRFILVISGTWYLGSGPNYEPEKTVGVKAGTYVYHKGGELHYDGAKDEPAVIQIWGIGPATSTQAPAK